MAIKKATKRTVGKKTVSKKVVNRAKKAATKVTPVGPKNKKPVKKSIRKGPVKDGTGVKVGQRVLKPQRDRVAGRKPTVGVDFKAGSDSAVVFEAMKAGADSRLTITKSLQEHFSGQKTRGGRDKPVTTVMNAVLERALKAGYEIESSWRLRKKRNTDEPSTVERKGASKPSTKKMVKKVVKPSTVRKTAVKKSVKRR